MNRLMNIFKVYPELRLEYPFRNKQVPEPNYFHNLSEELAKRLFIHSYNDRVRFVSPSKDIIIQKSTESIPFKIIYVNHKEDFGEDVWTAHAIDWEILQGLLMKGINLDGTTIEPSDPNERPSEELNGIPEIHCELEFKDLIEAGKQLDCIINIYWSHIKFNYPNCTVIGSEDFNIVSSEYFDIYKSGTYGVPQGSARIKATIVINNPKVTSITPYVVTRNLNVPKEFTPISYPIKVIDTYSLNDYHSIEKEGTLEYYDQEFTEPTKLTADGIYLCEPKVKSPMIFNAGNLVIDEPEISKEVKSESVLTIQSNSTTLRGLNIDTTNPYAIKAGDYYPSKDLLICDSSFKSKSGRILIENIVDDSLIIIKNTEFNLESPLITISLLKPRNFKIKFINCSITTGTAPLILLQDFTTSKSELYCNRIYGPDKVEVIFEECGNTNLSNISNSPDKVFKLECLLTGGSIDYKDNDNLFPKIININ